ncbi:Tat pathway signal protein [Candidatus Bathyarchaeota archaeon]|nr:MAG: Tat pathway signal protein [Candidatus Bathyarchaeota archaeon]
MWLDREVPGRREYLTAKPYLRFDESLWNTLLKKMVDAGINMVVIDLGDGVRYESHPEIAVKNAWSIEKLRYELGKMRDLGLEPIPKLNFSTCHDIWLGPYSRCVSTDTYYEVCGDLIDEVIEVFEKPRFFHLGMDEETAQHQRNYEYVVIRQFDLWWHDLLFLVRRVEKKGVRPWIWSDYVWRHPEEFYKRMPKSVLQSNWYYGSEFNLEIEYVKAYLDLDAHGYDQIPTGSNWSVPENFERTVDFCIKRLSKNRLLGFLQTVWKPTLEDFRDDHLEAIELVQKARMKVEN